MYQTVDRLNNKMNSQRGEQTSEESTIMQTDSIKSSSLLKLSDILSQNIILHPFIALRRTCQVNRKCSPFICIQPISLVPFLYYRQAKQGIPALYKGLSSELLVKGITLGAETAIIGYTDWPREVSPKRFYKDSLKVIALRGLSIAISTPFICSAVRETIQSVIVVRERPSFVDCLKDGFLRLLHMRSIPSARMLPIWLLIVPTVLYHVSHSAIWHATSKTLELFTKETILGYKLRSRHKLKQDAKLKRSVVNDESSWQHDDLTYDFTETSFDPELMVQTDNHKISSSLIASLVADVALLPVETILNSLYIQGTRTIIDNVDGTTVVLPVITNYDGMSECYRSIIKFEGTLGLYKGLGAIILQYSVHFLLFRAIYYLVKELKLNGRHSASPPRRRRPIQPIRPDHNRFIENNRHSTPNNPHQPNPPIESLLLQDNSMRLEGPNRTGREPSTIEFMHN